MATDSTKLIIELQTVLRGLNETLRGLDQIKKKLSSVASVKPNIQPTTGIDRAVAATERLRATQDRLTQSQQRAAKSTLGPQLDAHVQDFRRAEAAAAEFNKKLAGLGNSLRSIGQGLSTVGATLTATLTVPLVALGAASVNAAVELDSLKRGLTAITGSSDEARRQLERLTQIAKLPGIGFQEAIQGSIRLQAVGFSAKEAETALRQFSNAIALTGGGRDELNRVTVQLGQLAAKGKVLSQDLRPIIEAAPAVGRALLQAFGTVNADDIQELGLSSKEFLSILTSQLEQLPRAAAGAKNSFENFRDELFQAAAAVGTSLLPVLTRLAEAVGPIIQTLANGFAKLPAPLQVIVISFGAFLALLGPTLFIVGQLTTGVGRLLVGFAQLNAIGILPTIRNLRALAAGTLSAAEATEILNTAQLISSGLIVAINSGFFILTTALAVYGALQKDVVKVSREQVDVLQDQLNGLDQQVKFLDSLNPSVARTADEQERLQEIYDQLNLSAKARVTGITDEEKRLAALREELQKIVKLRRDEQFAQQSQIASKIADNAAAIESEDQFIQRLREGVQIRTRLIEAIQQSNSVDKDQQEQVRRLTAEYGGLEVSTSDAAQAVEVLQASNRILIGREDALKEASKDARTELKEQIPILKQLASEDKENIRALLAFAKTMGTFQGDVDKTTDILQAYIDRTREATKASDEFRNSFAGTADLLKSGEFADQLAKKRKALIEAAAANAREASDSFEGALKFLRAFIAAQPELRQAIQREAQIEGKSFDEFVQKSLEKAFGRSGRDKAGTSLRSAQEELAKALADVALASSEEQVRIEKEKNDRLLQAAEVGQKLQLISYREFLELRAQLTTASVDREITQQAAIVAAAKKTQTRLLAAASVPGIPAAERVKRQAQAAKANEEAIKAEGKLTELTAKRDQAQFDLRQQISLTQHEQINDIRQLDIELADLQGKIEDAFNAETLEKFREKLVDLGKAQVFVAKQLEDARKKGDADEVARLARELQLNKEQVDAIRLIVQQKEALGALAAAQELVRQAKEKQQQLEEDLTFQVQFRGLKEEDAIKQRLAGEERLNDSLTNAHETIRQIVEALRARGVEPPRALLDFLKEIQGAVKGLGELSFSEQFRLAQKEFDRLNDERLRKIADIERAVRERDIAEAEGLLLIRRINGQYSADLEQQLALLKQIAEQSNDTELQRQAQQAGETVKDANEQLAGFNRQLRSASIDALQEGFTNFFASLSDRTKTAKEKLLDLVNSVSQRIQQVIAENLSKQLIESLFGDGTEGGGIFASIKRLIGIGGGQGATGGIGAVAGVGAKTADATAAATALTTGAAAASTTFVAGVTTAGTGFSASVITSATSFAATILSAAAGFAAAVAASSAAQGISQGIGGLGSAIGAATGIFPAVEGGLVHIVEGGFPEAVLTTDPRHAARQLQILKAFLRETHGLGGRIRGLALGGFTDRIDISAPSVQVSNAGIGELAVAGAPSIMRLRQVLVDQRDFRNEINSPEGEQVLVDFLYKKQHVIRKLSSGK